VRAYKVWGLPLLGGIAFVVVWQLLVWLGGISPWLLPSPLQVIEAGWAVRTELMQSAMITFMGAVTGFLSATVIGFLLAVLFNLSRVLRWVFYPWALILQMVPVIILSPLFVVWFGPGFPSVVAVTFILCLFPVVANTTQGMMSADRNLQELFHVCGANRWQQLFWLRVPHGFPQFLTGVQISATLATVGAVAAELLASSSRDGGLGYLVVVYSRSAEIARVMATGLTACLIGFLMVIVVLLINRICLRKWHDSYHTLHHS
jgi:NitT/TauT family transport system permease protein